MDDYEIRVFISKEKLEALDLHIASISNILRQYNRNTPLGNFSIGNLHYDFRFE
jgi:multidrug efflux pump subunit AcrB